MNTSNRKKVLGVFYWHNPTRLGNLELVNELRNEFFIVIISNEKIPYLKGYCDEIIYISYQDSRQVVKVLLSKHKLYKFDGLITLSEGAVTLLSDCTRAMGLKGNEPEVSRLARNKFMMREKMETLGISQPNFFRVFSKEEAKYLFVEHFNSKYAFLKPPCIGGSSFCSRIESLEEIDKTWDYLYEESLNRTASDPLFSEQFQDNKYYLLLEELLGGVQFQHDDILSEQFPCFEVSVEGFIQGDSTFVYSITDKLLPKNIKYGEEYFWRMHSRVPASIKKVLEYLVNQINKGLGAKYGCSHSEFRIESADRQTADAKFGENYYKIRLIETALRPGGAYMQSAIRRVTGFNAIRAMALQACDLFVDEKIIYRKPGIMINLWSKNSGFVTKIEGLDYIHSLKHYLAFFHLYDGIGDYTLIPPDANRGMADALIIDSRTNLLQIKDWEILDKNNNPYQFLEKTFLDIISTFKVYTLE